MKLCCINATLFICSASSVSCLGQEFRPGAMVCLQRPNDMAYPVFGEILYVIIDDDRKCFAMNLYETDEFCTHYSASRVFPTSKFDIIAVDKLALHQVYHRYHV